MNTNKLCLIKFASFWLSSEKIKAIAKQWLLDLVAIFVLLNCKHLTNYLLKFSKYLFFQVMSHHGLLCSTSSRTLEIFLLTFSTWAIRDIFPLSGYQNLDQPTTNYCEDSKLHAFWDNHSSKTFWNPKLLLGSLQIKFLIPDVVVTSVNKTNLWMDLLFIL